MGLNLVLIKNCFIDKLKASFCKKKILNSVSNKSISKFWKKNRLNKYSSKFQAWWEKVDELGKKVNDQRIRKHFFDILNLAYIF